MFIVTFINIKGSKSITVIVTLINLTLYVYCYIKNDTLIVLIKLITLMLEDKE